MAIEVKKSLKTNRSYLLRIEKTSGDGFVEIKLPLTCEVTIERGILSGVNNGSFRIYNLNEESRNQIHKDFAAQIGNKKRIEFKAGYGDSQYTIFSGNVLSAFSSRDGSDYITEVIGFDGGHSRTSVSISKTLQAGTTNKKIAETLISELEKDGLSKGYIGDLQGESTRAVSLNGNCWDLLTELTEGDCFIDNEAINILKKNEFISDSVALISAETGLLETPVIESAKTTFSIIFEPRLTIGQKVKVKLTNTNSILNDREFKILSIRHSGVFSDAVSGTMITEIGTIVGAEAFKGISR